MHYAEQMRYWVLWGQKRPHSAVNARFFFQSAIVRLTTCVLYEYLCLELHDSTFIFIDPPHEMHFCTNLQKIIAISDTTLEIISDINSEIISEFNNEFVSKVS